MTSASTWVLCLTILTSARAGEYCDDFEEGGWGECWTEHSGSGTFGGDWIPISYDDLKVTIPDIPAPPNGQHVIYLELAEGSIYRGADMITSNSYIFPEGSSVSFSYWARSALLGTGSIHVKQSFGSGDNQTVLLATYQTVMGKPEWQTAAVTINESPFPSQVSSFLRCDTFYH